MDETATPTRPVVGFVGLGAMGGPMADHVARAGFAPRVFDVRPEQIEARLHHGATAATTVTEAVMSADVVIIVLHDDAQVLDVIDYEFIGSMAPNGIVVLHSTVTLEAVRTLRQRCEGSGRRLVDIGISGSVTGAEAGDLLLIAGGDGGTLESIRPLLDSYSRDLVHCGDVGTGMAVKAARNLIALSVMAVAADGLALAASAGVDRRLFADIVRSTDPSGHCQRALDGTMLTASGNTLDGIRQTGMKDLMVAAAIALELEVDVPTGLAAIDDWCRVVTMLGAELDDDNY